LGIHDLWLFVVSGLLLNISPGPDTAYIVARSTQLGWKAGAVAAIGAGAGALIHVTAAAVGLSALLTASATAFMVVKLLGAAYLVYIGAKMLLATRGGEGSGRAFDHGATKLSSVFLQGFLTNVLNPKVALFFLAFLPQFVDADAPSKILALLFLGLLFDFNGTPLRRLAVRASLWHRPEQRHPAILDKPRPGVFVHLPWHPARNRPALT
jgi:threonine/homoserine/homoserine lactone efflux protein